MIEYLLKNSEFSKIFKFLSPNFFRVVSPAVLLRVAQQLKRNRADRKAWLGLVQNYSTQILRDPLAIQMDLESTGERRVRPDLKSVHASGKQILTLFFHQILNQSTWILDLRSDAFAVDAEGRLSWRPQSYFYEISPAFLAEVRSLYRGFYTSDVVLFDQALMRLGLSSARESLRNHFGVGDQTQVQFRLKTFQNTFTEVFEACARDGVKLQPDFFVLGIILLGLYENLETLGLSFDVRGCFEQAMKMNGAGP